MTDRQKSQTEQWKKTQRTAYYGGYALTIVGLGLALLSSWTALNLEIVGMVVLLAAIIAFQMESKATIWMLTKAIQDDANDE